MKKYALLLSVMFFITACGGTQYRDPAEDKGSMEFGPKEVKMTVNKMLTSMYDFLKNEWKKPAYLQVKKFRNMTSEHIDTQIITNEIATNLIKKRIKFIDDTLTEDSLKEMEDGMTGIIDPEFAVPIGSAKSPNMYLSGDIRDNVRTVGGKRIQYLVVTLKLYNLKTREVEWQDQQEFLKATSKNKYSL
jgi:penicillin-binding protein activator